MQKMMKAAGATYNNGKYMKGWSVNVTGTKGLNAVSKQLKGVYANGWYMVNNAAAKP